MTATMPLARYVVIAVALFGASPALAQTAPWPPRVLVSINAGMQLTGESADQELAPVINGEPSALSVSTPFRRGLSFDGGATIRVRGAFGIAAAVSVYSKDGEGTVSGQIPHPLQFNRPRTLTGTATGLSRTEVGVHIDAAYIAKSRGRLSAVVVAGVSIFNFSQTAVTGVNYSETYPFDSVTFTSATTVSASKAVVGFNGGVDVTWKLSRKAGVGALVRFSRASATLAPAGGGDISTSAGGLVAGAGIRFGL